VAPDFDRAACHLQALQAAASPGSPATARLNNPPGASTAEAGLESAGEPPKASSGEAAAGDDEDPFAEPLPPLRRLPADPDLPDPPPAVPLPTSREETLEDDPEFRWARETVRQVGTLVHRVLHSLSRGGLEGWDRSRLEDLRPAFRSSLARLGVPQHELATGTEATVQALSRLLECPRGRWILGAHQEARSEYALAGRLGGRVVRVKVDRTFVDAEGLRWIVDYKTGTHEGSDVEAFLDAEQERYRPQLERYALLMRRLDPRPVRLGLYFPMLGGWREWEAPRDRP
jgi:hypothetical protein